MNSVARHRIVEGLTVTLDLAVRRYSTKRI